MEEGLAYFREAVTNPLSVPPWSKWWAVNWRLAQQVFERLDYVKLRRRRLRGAREILQNLGELPDSFIPPASLISGSCSECGERIIMKEAGSGGGAIECPICGALGTYDAVRNFSIDESQAE